MSRYIYIERGIDIDIDVDVHTDIDINADETIDTERDTDADIEAYTCTYICIYIYTRTYNHFFVGLCMCTHGRKREGERQRVLATQLFLHPIFRTPSLPVPEMPQMAASAVRTTVHVSGSPNETRILNKDLISSIM